MSVEMKRRPVRLEVEVDVYGHWCVHMSVGHARENGDHLWMVSHVESGRSLAPLLGAGTDYWTACAIAEDIATVPALNRRQWQRIVDAGWAISAIVGEKLEMELG